MKKIYAIVGKACAGKDTLVKKTIEKNNYKMALSFTTRPMREGEKQGVEYNFITEDLMKNLEKEGKIVEYTKYNVAGGDTWYYGLTKEELEKDEYILVIVNPSGVKQLKEIYGERVCVIYITADDKKRIKRYLDRDEKNNVAECCRRYIADEKDFKDLEFDYKIVNENLVHSYKIFDEIIKKDISKDILKLMDNDFKRNPARFLGGRCA